MSPEESIIFDCAADYYDETRGFPAGAEQPIAALIARAGHLTKNSRVLEIGIGTGRVALPLSTHVGAVYGIDLSRLMIKRLHRKRQAEPIFPVEGDAARLPFPTSVFDAVLAVHVFHLIPAWKTVLREVARVLRPGALLLHGEQHGTRGLDALWAVWESVVPPDQHPTVGVPHAERDTFLEAHGWRPTGEMQSHAYTYNLSPRQFLDRLARRTWSRTWKLSDAELEKGLAAVRSAIEATCGDPAQPVELESVFEMHAYLPPLLDNM